MPRFTPAPKEQEKRQLLMDGGFSEKAAKQVLNGVWELRDVKYAVFVKTPSGKWFFDSDVNTEEADELYEGSKRWFFGKED